jgi:tRNA dimethylallyltransferase
MPLLVLVGPTGVGKTATAIELCKLLEGEIVSADSMQIYRGLDIATAKPTQEEQVRARHHLIDVREPHEFYSAAQWADDARAAIADILKRGKTPLVAGGTGFYLRALLEPHTLASVPPNPELRAALEAESAEHGIGHLHRRLSEMDGPAAARLHPNDTHRVIRAMEIVLSSDEAVPSKPPTPDAPRDFEAAVFGLTMPREALVARLEARVDAMMAAGFMAELRTVSQIVPPDCIAMQGVGYRQMWPVLQDESLKDEAIELWKRDTRRYAKRQMTWFRHQLPTQWMDVTEYPNCHSLAEHIAPAWRSFYAANANRCKLKDG